MGAAAVGKCHSSNAQAVDAYFSSIGPHVIATGETVQFHRSSSGWQQCSFKSGVPSSCFPVVEPLFPACADDSDRFLDGVAIGWMIAAAMAVAFAMVQARKAL